VEFQISPDEKYLAAAWGDVEIFDLASGKEFDVSIPDRHFDLGFLDWSSDSKKLVFSTVKGEQWTMEMKDSPFIYTILKTTLSRD
jgi:hypothetical protein